RTVEFSLCTCERDTDGRTDIPLPRKTSAIGSRMSPRALSYHPPACPYRCSRKARDRTSRCWTKRLSATAGHGQIRCSCLIWLRQARYTSTARLIISSNFTRNTLTRRCWTLLLSKINNEIGQLSTTE